MVVRSGSFLGSSLLLLALLTAGWPATANHGQVEAGKVVVFDHKTGNEWWVEAVLSGQDGGMVSGVSARDDGGPWVPLTKRSWGAWAASFHVEPGHRMQFRAEWAGGAQVLSCWFTHPAGAEQCDTASGFDATFTLVKGNEWWVQTQVSPSAGFTVAAVDVRLNGGPWNPLQLQSWGVREWARSYHIVDGTVVQFRATTTTGAVDLSGCYRWIPPQTPGADEAASVDCGGAAPPPPAFNASFRNVRGNAWWVEVDVVGDFAVAGVEFRLEGGPWRHMAKQSWGSWARGGMEIPGDSLVQFRARSSAGAVDFSNPGWRWADETASIRQVPAAASTLEVEFHHSAGAADWVRINVLSTRELAGVDWRVAGAGAAWNPMAREASGFWNATAGTPIPEGADVEFRARSSAEADGSDAFPWPPWPQPGSWAEYRMRLTDEYPDGSSDFWDGYAVATAVPGGWETRCELRQTHTNADGTQSSTFYVGPMGRPGALLGPRRAAVGDVVGVDMLMNCFRTGFAVEVAGYGPQRTALRTSSGDPITVDAWHGTEAYDAVEPNGFDVWWEDRYGMVFSWEGTEFVGANGGISSRATDGWLLNTDAPLT